jgi:hypothetical protein
MIRQSELIKIRQLSEDIRNNLTSDHSINFLTVKTGLNENKLQAGFKLLFNNTVRR